ncbi:ABC transporter E family member 2, partial [Diplonema papillatum]
MLRCHLCEETVDKPGSQSIKDIYKETGLALCVKCYPVFEANHVAVLRIRDDPRWPCAGCKRRLPLLEGYCAPCTVAWQQQPVSHGYEDEAEVESRSDPSYSDRLTGVESTDTYECSSCRTVNEAACSRCIVCGTPSSVKGCAPSSPSPSLHRAAPPGTDRATTPPPRAQRREHTPINSETTALWSCSACSVDNEPGKSACIACGISRSAPRAARHYEDDDDDGDAATGEEEAATDGGWNCRVCTLDNLLTDTECGACSAPRPKRFNNVGHHPQTRTGSTDVAKAAQEAAPSFLPVPPPREHDAPDKIHNEPASKEEWECPVCTLLNSPEDPTCGACEAPRPDSDLEDDDGMGEVAGEADENVWTCSRCTAHNHDEHLLCSQCQAPRDANQWACPKCTAVSSTTGLCAVCGYREETAVSATAPSATPGKSWTCGKCNRPNDVSEDCCMDCGTVRFWICDTCTEANLGVAKTCCKCNTLRGKVSVPKWQCVKCNTHNRHIDRNCIKCTAPRVAKKSRSNVLVLKPSASNTTSVPVGTMTRRQKSRQIHEPPPPQPVKAAKKPTMVGRYIMLVDGLKGDRATPAALRQTFDKHGAVNVQIVVKDRRKTGKALIEFDSHDEMLGAIKQKNGKTICESKVKCYPCNDEIFQSLPPAYQKGKPVPVAKPDWAGTGERLDSSRVAVVRQDRCKYDKCSLECLKACPVGAVTASGLQACQIDEAVCIGCKACTKKRGGKSKKVSGCPFDALVIVQLPREVAGEVTTRYGRNGFTLCRLPQLRKNSVLGIIGENGSGKSTALKVLAGKLVPNTGDPSLTREQCWKEITSRYKGTELQPLLASLAQGNSVASLKVQHVDKLKDAVKVTARNFLTEFAPDVSTMLRLVTELDLTHILDRQVSVLSGGELQRVAVAAACCKQAQVYLFDEPSSYLDVKQRLKVCETIRSLMDGNRYVLCVEHDLAVCDYLADHVALIHGKQSAFGIVTRSMNVRDGINSFLRGYIEQANVKFRSHALVFKMHETADVAAHDALSYANATKTRDGFKLSVDRGNLRRCEVTALLGENGCGKTTLLEIMAGTLPMDGDGNFFGESTDAYLKPQVIRMPAGQTVGDIITEAFGNVEKDHPQIYEEVMLPLKVDDLFVLDADKLSGGEMQRVALALALGSEKEVILIDEPSAFLDAEQRMTAAKAIRKVASLRHKVIVVVEHDLMMTSFMADRVVQQQNALQRDAEGLALLEKRLLDLEAGLARREAEVEAAEREIGAAQKRAREQDEAEKEAKRPRGGEELPGEGGVPLMPAELMPGLPRARAEEIFLAFDEQDPGFWAGLGPTLQRELGSLEDEREVLALLDGAAVAGQDVGDDDDDDDFAFLDPERWRTMQPTAANMRGFEDAVRRLYRFKGNQQLQDRRDDVTERVRDLVRLRRGESGPPKRMWILRLGGLFHSYEEQNAEYETRDPSAALVMRDVLRVELLPERVRQARRRFTAQFKAAPKSVPPRARGRGGFAAWERRVAVFEGGATSKKTTAQRASIVASLTRFTAVAGLQAAPPALRIKAFATAMLGKGMTQEQLEAYVARVPGQRGRPRTGEMRTASVGKYVEVLGAKLGVPSGDLAAMKKAILKARLERREVPAHAPPITLEQQRTLVEGLVRGGDEQVTVAACLAWAGALRMADLRALAPTDVVIVGPGLLRVSWWTTKEASLRMRESEVTYRVPLGVALRVSRWVQRGARFTEATTRKLLREARKLFPVCAEHSWKRGALQHLARSGAGWEDLLLMARHQSKDTLKRYLWGCLTPDSVRTARASLLLHTPDLKSSHPLRDWANSRHPGAAGYLDRLLAWGESRLRGDMGEQSEADFDRAVTLEDWLLRGDVSTHVEGVRAQEEALSELASRTYTKAPSPVYRTSRGPIDTMPVTKADYGKVERGLWEDEIRVLRQLTREPMLLSHERHHAPPSSDITEADLAVMLQSGVVRRVEKRPRITLKVFKIPKKGKEETRLLIDGRPFDSRTSQPLSPITPSLRDVEGFVLDHAWFATLDLLGYFYQLPVSDALADYLGFRAANAYYVFRIAVPGIARAPAIAQLTTLG